MKRVFLIYNFLFFLVCITCAQTNPALTLEACIKTAIEKNLSVLQSSLQAKRDDATWQQSKASLLPNISANLNYGINQGRSINPFTNAFVNQQLSFSQAGINASVPVWNYNQLQNIIKQNNLLYQASLADEQQAKETLTLNIITAFLQILAAEDIAVILKNNVLVTKSQLNRLEQLNAEGATSPFNVSDLKVQLANDELAVINADNAIQQAKISLFQLMNVDYSLQTIISRKDVNMSTLKYEIDEKNIYEEALNKLSIVKAAKLRVAGADKALAVARSTYYPILSLFGGVGTNYSSVAQQFSFVNESFVATSNYVDIGGTKYPVFEKQQNFKAENFGLLKQFDNNLNTNYGLSLQIPILNGLRAKNRVLQAKINSKQFQLVETNTKVQLYQAIQQAYQQMSTCYERVSVFDRQMKAVEESFKAATIRFENGVINAVEYLQVRNSVDRARLNQVQNKYEFALRTRILDFYRGALRYE